MLVAASRASPVLTFRYRPFNGDIDLSQHLRAHSALVPMCTYYCRFEFLFAFHVKDERAQLHVRGTLLIAR